MSAPRSRRDAGTVTRSRAGRAYWHSAHGHLYALELANLGAAGRR